MDQVRTILGALWQQRFWVLSSIGTVVAIVCWMSASGTLVEEFKKRQTAIKSSFSAVQGLNGQPYHPNQAVIDGNREQVKLESEITLSIWEELYGRQREEVLYWPKDHLDERFLTHIETLKFADPFPSGHSSFMRNNYWNYIGERFDGLLETVKALETSGSFRGAGRGGGLEREFGSEGAPGYGGGFNRNNLNDEEEEQDYLVQWLDQGNLRGQLSFKKKPSSLAIWVTQENLWVYETLLNVIAKTNQARGATRPDNAAVRVIVALEVGQDAIAGGKTQGNLVAPLGSSGASLGSEGIGGRLGEGGSRRGGPYGQGGEGGREFGPEGGSRSEGEEDESYLLAFRYIDPSTGEPLSGESGEFDGEFRLLPVRMVLMMEQTWIPRVLTECANAALPVEIKTLRVNSSLSGAGFGNTGSRTPVRRQTGSSGGNDKSLVELELQGVVHIYNKPDKSRLGIQGEEQFADASGSTVQR